MTGELFFRSFGNVSQQDGTRLLILTHFAARNVVEDCSEATINQGTLREEDMDLDLMCQNLSKFKECAATYIAGYVIKMVRRKIQCKECRSALLCKKKEATAKYSLTLRKKMGLINICVP